ncbi:hypothetical protein [Acidocella sp.]|uniref:hypothetical protein n=1 Tax=Acidocella sp. TaxID=50710 RepID=UPI00263749A0|nr:hypothetical protein [Acidocella sp.]
MTLQNAHRDTEQFRPSTLGLAPRFPAWRFRAKSEFDEFLKTRQPVLDSRHLHQLSLATREKTFERPGTCAVCLCPTLFQAAVNGEILSDGKRMPNWREELQCGCARRLNNRQRAVLHLAQSCGLLGWMKPLLLGAPADFTLACRALAPEIMPLRRFHFTGGTAHLAAASASCHFAISQDELQDIEPLQSALTELARVLVPGGRLIFTVPFYFGQSASVLTPGPAMRAGAHQLGWDILRRLQDAGFSNAEALLYWSEELGYLGNMNFLFLAVR